MKIETHLLSGWNRWQAYDADTMDGAEDSGPLALMRGEGDTPAEAINDLVEQVIDYHYGDGHRDGYKEGKMVAPEMQGA